MKVLNFLKKFIYLFIYGCVAVSRLSLVAASRGYFSFQCRASHCSGFSCCGAWTLGERASVVVSRGLRCCGSWTPEHRPSSCSAWAQLLRGMWDPCGTRAWTHIPCIGKQIFNHCATRETHESPQLLRRIFLKTILIANGKKATQTDKQKRNLSAEVA